MSYLSNLVTIRELAQCCSKLKVMLRNEAITLETYSSLLYCLKTVRELEELIDSQKVVIMIDDSQQGKTHFDVFVKADFAVSNPKGALDAMSEVVRRFAVDEEAFQSNLKRLLSQPLAE